MAADPRPTEVLVIGSGAGGAVTALTLAQAGREVLVLEEGVRDRLPKAGPGAPDAFERLYRRRGMTPLLGTIPIAYVEGCTVGGSTEINSGFWHRTPAEAALRWRARFDLQEASAEQLVPHLEWAERLLEVALHPDRLPESSRLFAEGARAMGWSFEEIPRTGARGGPRGVAHRLLAPAEAAGARVLTGCRARLLLFEGDRVTGALVERTREDGGRELARIDAEHVFVCAGPTRSAALLRRSGVRAHVGDTLKTHPMLKVVARFPTDVDAGAGPLPLVQVKEFWPELTLGGAYFSPGHAALVLAENGPDFWEHLRDPRKLAAYYVAVRGVGQGSVRPGLWGDQSTSCRYELAEEDVWNLSRGLARLAALLLAAGAEEVIPSVRGLAPIRRQEDAVRWLDDRLPKLSLGLSTVHAFSTCPIGERRDRCAADSHGRVHGYRNLYVNDASMLPDSPGVNPQGSVMALARRNALRFAEERR